jgi:hypothetical protein
MERLVGHCEKAELYIPDVHNHPEQDAMVILAFI